MNPGKWLTLLGPVKVNERAITSESPLIVAAVYDRRAFFCAVGGRRPPLQKDTSLSSFLHFTLTGPRIHCKSRHGARRERFCLAARSRARSIAKVLRDERATKPQGKRTSALRVVFPGAAGFVAHSVKDHCGYSLSLAPRQPHQEKPTRPMATFAMSSNRRYQLTPSQPNAVLTYFLNVLGIIIDERFCIQRLAAGCPSF